MMLSSAFKQLFVSDQIGHDLQGIEALNVSRLVRHGREEENDELGIWATVPVHDLMNRRVC